MPAQNGRAVYFAMAAALLFASLGYPQCQIGVNQPPRKVILDGFAAFPKFGARVYDRDHGEWVQMVPSGIRVAYCKASGQNCVREFADLDFTGAQKTAMNTSRANWTAARTSNGSNLSFNLVSSIGYYDFFSVEVFRATDLAGSAAVTHSGFEWMDYDGDGVQDEVRTAYAWIEIDDAYSGSALTEIVTHELGHTMGLADCLTCTTGTTIMKTPAPTTLQSPSACDNAQVATMMQ